MIIDIHTHAANLKVFPNQFLQKMFDYKQAGLTEGKIHQLLGSFLMDRDGSQHVKQMDLAHIEKSVVLIVDGGVGMGESDLSIEEIYIHHQKLNKNHPDRLIIFAGIDPRRPESFDVFKRGIEKYGFRGLKLYPPMGFSLDDERLIPILDYCDIYKLPVVVHTGPSLDILHNKYANPLLIKNVVKKYPKANFILAHAALNTDENLKQMLKRYNNLFVDISGCQTVLKKDSGRMNTLFSNELDKKILFGSDWPLFNLFSTVKRDLEMIMKMAELTNIPQNKIGNVMYNNAKSILLDI